MATTISDTIMTTVMNTTMDTITVKTFHPFQLLNSRNAAKLPASQSVARKQTSLLDFLKKKSELVGRLAYFHPDSQRTLRMIHTLG